MPTTIMTTNLANAAGDVERMIRRHAALEGPWYVKVTRNGGVVELDCWRAGGELADDAEHPDAVALREALAELAATENALTEAQNERDRALDDLARVSAERDQARASIGS